MPFNDQRSLEIRPNERLAYVVTGSAGVLTGNSKWVGGVIAPNGRIYAMPNDRATILEIDVLTDIVEFGSVGTAANKWMGGVLATNSRIYGIPHASAAVLELSPSATVVNFSRETLHSAYINKL
jgi:glutamate mutase epsilon subunit